MESKFFLRRIILAISIVMGFVFLVSFFVFYVVQIYGVDACACGIPIYLIIIILSSLGVFVGTLTYYLLTESFLRKKELLKVNILKTLDFLETDEKTILTTVLNNGGKITQSKLATLTGMDKVRVFRKLSTLERKGILMKERKGISNVIILREPFRKLFAENE